mmetsp:Transcript_2983/g.6107  ORF Transcript_2983/g.6107 Transcript_2983/m.6107 type:complete len:375 (+) Transcript_2983:51-1175(+)
MLLQKLGIGHEPHKHRLHSRKGQDHDFALGTRRSRLKRNRLRHDFEHEKGGGRSRPQKADIVRRGTSKGKHFPQQANGYIDAQSQVLVTSVAPQIQERDIDFHHVKSCTNDQHFQQLTEKALGTHVGNHFGVELASVTVSNSTDEDVRDERHKWNVQIGSIGIIFWRIIHEIPRIRTRPSFELSTPLFGHEWKENPFNFLHHVSIIHRKVGSKRHHERVQTRENVGFNEFFSFIRNHIIGVKTLSRSHLSHHSHGSRRHGRVPILLLLLFLLLLRIKNTGLRLSKASRLLPLRSPKSTTLRLYVSTTTVSSLLLLLLLLRRILPLLRTGRLLVAWRLLSELIRVQLLLLLLCATTTASVEPTSSVSLVSRVVHG